MKIWLADYSFETTLGKKDNPLFKKVVDVVTVRIPNSHINRKSDFYDRAIRSLFDGEIKLLAKDKFGRYKAKIEYKKIIGRSNHGRTLETAY